MLLVMVIGLINGNLNLVSCGNYRTIELLLEILRGPNVGSDLTDKARVKLSELVDTI